MTASMDKLELKTTVAEVLNRWPRRRPEARLGEEAPAAAARLGDRVVLTAGAEGLVRRTDAGPSGSICALLQEAAQASGCWRPAPGRGCSGCLSSRCWPGAWRCTSAWCRSPCSGPLVVFESGDAATEVPADQVARLIPLTDADADAGR